METFKLTKDQQATFDLIEGTNDNICLVGKPGTGKSVLTNALIDNGNKSYTVAAPTGLAALNVRGRTLHSIFRIPTSHGILAPDYNKFDDSPNTVNHIKYNIRTLIIDEVSMVRADTFDYVDRYMQYCKGNQLPFGGVQVILVGDFFQLQPVTKHDENIQLKEAGYRSPFVFSAQAFKSFKVVQLKEVLRQKGDNKFITILNSIRNGDALPQQIIQLNKRVGRPEDIRIKMCCTNKEADLINDAEMRRLPGDEFVFQAEEYGSWPAYPIEQQLRLRIGAQVMIRMNGADRPTKHRGEFVSQVVNGTLAKVVSVYKKSAVPQLNNDIAEPEEDHVVVETDRGIRAKIFRKSWERKRKFKNQDGKWEEETLAYYNQMPIIPAWAISVHKSQGQSFDKAHFDPGKIFAAGQGYVALSRVRSLAGLTLEKPVTQKSFWSNAHVKQFFNELES